MRLINFVENNKDNAAIRCDDKVFPIKMLNDKYNTEWSLTVQEIINNEEIFDLNKWYKDVIANNCEKINEFLNYKDLTIGPLYRRTKRIWGIGLNYSEHAGDLAEKSPTGIPASFIKNESTICGPNDNIIIPTQSKKVTAEAELGVIIGKKCRDIEEEDWIEYVAGFTTILDQTAEDILRLNPRYLTMVKNFDTFLSFGPELVTPDEIKELNNIKVRTMINGKVHAENFISNMTFSPSFLVSFYSKVFTWNPGDILSTGTPRAVHIQEGDIVGCEIDGFESLSNGVVNKN